MIRYAITAGNASYLAQNASARLSDRASRWAERGIDYIQLREKALPAGQLLRMLSAMTVAIRERNTHTRILVNGRADVAVAAEADGVHLTSAAGELTANQVRRVFAAAGRPAPVISASCHSLEEVRRAVGGDVGLILFGPIFEKRVGDKQVLGGLGLEALHQACAVSSRVPVLALGGVSKETIEHCLAAGAAGVAGIRLFD